MELRTTNLYKLFDKVANTKMPLKLKSVLLILITLTMLFESVLILLIVKQVTDIVNILMSHL